MPSGRKVLNFFHWLCVARRERTLLRSTSDWLTGLWWLRPSEAAADILEFSSGKEEKQQKPTSLVHLLRTEASSACPVSFLLCINFKHFVWHTFFLLLLLLALSIWCRAEKLDGRNLNVKSAGPGHCGMTLLDLSKTLWFFWQVGLNLTFSPVVFFFLFFFSVVLCFKRFSFKVTR